MDTSGGAAEQLVPVLVDAHAHLHPCFDLLRFLDHAAHNFERAATHLGLAGASGCLLLADFDDSHGFRRLLERGRIGGWTLQATAEPESLVARKAAARIVCVAGRQIRTAERLEVLALLTTRSYADGTPLPDLVATVSADGGIAVVPWGFGKWTGSRGAVVARALRRAPPPFPGDNGTRLRGAPLPGLLRQARRRGVPLLPGSDPLPFPDHEGRAGSCGFVAVAHLNDVEPAASLRGWLRGLTQQPRVWVGGRGPLDFVRDQLRMQLRMRRGRS